MAANRITEMYIYFGQSYSIQQIQVYYFTKNTGQIHPQRFEKLSKSSLKALYPMLIK